MAAKAAGLALSSSHLAIQAPNARHSPRKRRSYPGAFRASGGGIIILTRAQLAHRTGDSPTFYVCGAKILVSAPACPCLTGPTSDVSRFNTDDVTGDSAEGFSSSWHLPPLQRFQFAYNRSNDNCHCWCHSNEETDFLGWVSIMQSPASVPQQRFSRPGVKASHLPFAEAAGDWRVGGRGGSRPLEGRVCASSAARNVGNGLGVGPPEGEMGGRGEAPGEPPCGAVGPCESRDGGVGTRG